MLDDGTRGSGNIIEFDVDELNLGYRKSRIADDGFIVLSATFNLAPGNAAMIKADMDDYRQRREDKQPLDMPSAGSTFKRPEGYFAGKLIMDAGLRGHAVGGAQVSEKHCGFIVNADHATAADVDELIRDIQANSQRAVRRRPRTRSPPSRRIPLTKKAPKGAFTIFISDNQSGVSRPEPERVRGPPARHKVDREFRTQRRPLNVAFVLRRTVRAGNLMPCGRARGPTYFKPQLRQRNTAKPAPAHARASAIEANERIERLRRNGALVAHNDAAANVDTHMTVDKARSTPVPLCEESATIMPTCSAERSEL